MTIETSQHGASDDTCHDRCSALLAWFQYHTRGLLDGDEAHEILDMLLNKLAEPQADHTASAGNSDQTESAEYECPQCKTPYWTKRLCRSCRLTATKRTPQ